MARFRVYLLDGSGRIVSVEDVEFEASREALDFARRLVANRQSHAFELWQGRDRLHKETVDRALYLRGLSHQSPVVSALDKRS